MITVNNDAEVTELSIVQIKSLVDFVFDFLNIEKKQNITVSFCESSVVQKYNKEYRKINATTDVLSFSDPDEEFGEIIIDPSIVKLNADEFNIDYREELIRVVVHGLLHILGYEHKGNLNSKENMFIVQEQIISSFLENE